MRFHTSLHIKVKIKGACIFVVIMCLSTDYTYLRVFNQFAEIQLLINNDSRFRVGGFRIKRIVGITLLGIESFIFLFLHEQTESNQRKSIY